MNIERVLGEKDGITVTHQKDKQNFLVELPKFPMFIKNNFMGKHKDGFYSSYLPKDEVIAQGLDQSKTYMTIPEGNVISQQDRIDFVNRIERARNGLQDTIREKDEIESVIKFDHSEPGKKVFINYKKPDSNFLYGHVVDVQLKDEDGMLNRSKHFAVLKGKEVGDTVYFNVVATERFLSREKGETYANVREIIDDLLPVGSYKRLAFGDDGRVRAFDAQEQKATNTQSTTASARPASDQTVDKVTKLQNGGMTAKQAEAHVQEQAKRAEVQDHAEADAEAKAESRPARSRKKQQAASAAM